MAQIDLTDDEIVSAIKAKIDFYLTQAGRYQAMLAAANINGIGTVTPSMATSTLKPVKQDTLFILPSSGAKKKGFDDIVLDVFDDGIPKRTRDVMTWYTAQTGKEIERKNIASRLSTLAKAKGTIRNFEIETSSQDYKFWWGRADWFDHGVIKPEYLAKIKSPS